ncbi:MAG: amidohydrolase family protein [Prevotella sp.]|nr:amidohydrolase family protein [Candidatus Prevotella equi]
MKKHYLFYLLALLLAFTACSKNDNVDSTVADMVVYGTIYTVEDAAPQVEAFAVKDGKYVYVGNVDGAKAYVGQNTVVVDQRGNGMVTPAFTEGHAHYLMSNGMEVMGSINVDMNAKPNDLLALIKDAYQKAKAEGKAAIYGFGWTYQIFEKEGMPTLAQLNAACPDIPLYVADGEGHKGLANTECMKKAGIIDEQGHLLISEIKGGEIVVDNLGNPTGLFKEQAGTYCRLRGIDFLSLMDESKAMKAVTLTRDALHSKGFVSYIDGWSNYFGNNRFYEAAQALDKSGELNLCLGMAYEVESSETDREGAFKKAFATNAFATNHVNPRYIKMFVDGTVETHTGYVRHAYVDAEGGVSKPNWMPEEFAAVTADVNAHDYTMHVHAMGDEAVHLAVTSFVNNGRKELRNTLVHVRNVLPEDYAVMAANDIVVTSGVLWHIASPGIIDELKTILPETYATEFYPIKSYFDKGVKMSSHSDFPALSGSSEMPFYIMETCVTGNLPKYSFEPFWTAELVTRQQALKAMTINGAYQMKNEKERGSIKVGKYADFLLVDKDVMTDACPANQIHEANVTGTFFEGKQVYRK